MKTCIRARLNLKRNFQFLSCITSSFQKLEMVWKYTGSKTENYIKEEKEVLGERNILCYLNLMHAKYYTRITLRTWILHASHMGRYVKKYFSECKRFKWQYYDPASTADAPYKFIFTL